MAKEREEKDVEKGAMEKVDEVAVHRFGFDESRSKCSGMAAPQFLLMPRGKSSFQSNFILFILFNYLVAL